MGYYNKPSGKIESINPRIEKIYKQITHELLQEANLWLLVIDKIVSLEELESSWSLSDAYKVIALIDMKNDVLEEKARESHVNSQKPTNQNRLSNR